MQFIPFVTKMIAACGNHGPFPGLSDRRTVQPVASEGQVSISLSGWDLESDSGGTPDANRNHCEGPVGVMVTL